MNKKHTPSKYQAAVYTFISDGSGNAVVDAVAGSGKSTTIVNALNLTPEDKEHENYIRYQDKVDAIRYLSHDLNWASETISRINTIFSDKAQGICLSTIHKSKGLEADRVFILAPETMYHERAMRIDWMAEQEANLVYVAYTRAKHYLGFITDYVYE